MKNSGVSAKNMMADIQKIGRRREAFCKKMWVEINKKKEEFKADVDKYQENLRVGRIKESSSE